MEHRDTAELATGPFCLVFIEVRVHRLQEGTDEGNFPIWANDAPFPPFVATCRLSVRSIFAPQSFLRRRRYPSPHRRAPQSRMSLCIQSRNSRALSYHCLVQESTRLEDVSFNYTGRLSDRGTGLPVARGSSVPPCPILTLVSRRPRHFRFCF